MYLWLGFLALGLGIVGAFLPVLPTTPFAILAAFLFSKSSPKMEQYILNLPTLGPLVREWREHCVINPRAKVLCVAMIVVVMGSSLYKLDFKPIPTIGLSVIAFCVITFVVSRKSYR